MYRTGAGTGTVQRKVRSLNQDQNHVKMARFCNTGYHTVCVIEIEPSLEQFLINLRRTTKIGQHLHQIHTKI
jgi:hypothetical protein